jgi:hypothetical protein
MPAMASISAAASAKPPQSTWSPIPTTAKPRTVAAANGAISRASPRSKVIASFLGTAPANLRGAGPRPRRATAGRSRWRPITSAMARTGTPSSATPCRTDPAGAVSSAKRKRGAASSRCTAGQWLVPSPM